MSLKRLANLAFWLAALAIVVWFAYDTVAGGYRLGGREGALWSLLLLVGLIIGAVLTAQPKRN